MARTAVSYKFIDKTPYSPRIVARAIQLRTQFGHTYDEIGTILNLPKGTPWRLCNKARYRANAKESMDRYIARGRIPLCDMKKAA